MKNLLMLFSAMASVVMMTTPAVAEDAVSAGKVKVVNAEKKDFVLTDTPARIGRSSWVIPSLSIVAARRARAT